MECWLNTSNICYVGLIYTEGLKESLEGISIYCVSFKFSEFIKVWDWKVNLRVFCIGIFYVIFK